MDQQHRIGIFRHEIVQTLLQLTKRYILATLRDLLAVAAEQGIRGAELQDAYEIALESVKQWNARIWSSEVARLCEQVPNIHKFVRDSFLLYVKDLHVDSAHDVKVLSTPDPKEFIQLVLCHVIELPDTQDVRFFQHAPTQQGVVADAVRLAFLDMTKGRVVAADGNPATSSASSQIPKRSQPPALQPPATEFVDDDETVYPEDSCSQMGGAWKPHFSPPLQQEPSFAAPQRRSPSPVAPVKQHAPPPVAVDEPEVFRFDVDERAEDGATQGGFSAPPLDDESFGGGMWDEMT